MLSSKTFLPWIAGTASILDLVSAQKYLLVLGDSYSTTSSWVGSTAPSSSNPIGNPTFPGQTTAGGLNWVGNAIAVYNSTQVFAYDLAQTGATTDNDIVSTYTQYNLDDQVETLIPQYLLPWTEASASDTLVAIWIGINDVGNPFVSNFRSYLLPAEKTVVTRDRYWGLMDDLYADGFTNYVLFTVPPFDLAPAFQYEETASLISDIESYNLELSSRLATFKSSHSDVTATLFDTAPTFNTVISNPTAYGAADAVCIAGDGTSCLWTDSYHPGLAIHKLLAQALVEAVSFF
ncbi:carbohydrate esterase family 16 protein [Xylariaceae sp. FL1019]|nr:carbohydrate esterase family 16 protein [Xylariaceae sp. FL1019]